jgi:membrane-associated PAP2 superfamily phosphatase
MEATEQFTKDDYRTLKRLAIAGAALFAFLACVPLHGLDDALIAPFFNGTSFPLHGNSAVEFLHSYAGKIPAILAALWLVYAAVRPDQYAPGGISRRKAALWTLLAMLLALGLVAFLKKATGMDCPWDLSIYGGSARHSTPLAEMSRGNFSGHCWPSGYSGGIFCVYAFCFYLCMRQRPREIRSLAFAAVTALGLLGGVLQMARGAHFATHVVASMGLDFALCFAVLSPLLRRAAGITGSKEQA